MNPTLVKHPAVAVPPTCCRNGVDAARQGHLACLQSLHKQGGFARFHDQGRAEAGEVRRAEAWLAALAACDGGHPEILKWLLAEGWPLSEAERLPWHFKDVADPSLLTWYTEGRPSLQPRCKARAPSWVYPLLDVTAVDWGAQSEWAEMSNMAGLNLQGPRSFFCHNMNGGIRGKSGAHQDWYPQEFQVLWRACKSGNLACQRIIVEAGCRSTWVGVLAALTGQLEFLKFAMEQGCPCEGPTLVAAAAGGHADCFRQVLTAWFDVAEKVPFHLQMHQDPVMAGSQRDFLHWFFSERFEWDYGMLTCKPDLDTNLELWIVKAALAAAENGHLEVLKCIMTRHAQTVSRQTGLANPASAAVAGGRLPCLEFACECGCTPHPKSVELALPTGHKHCVPYLISHGIEMSSLFSYHAARGGHLGLLELQAARDELAYKEGGPHSDEAMTLSWANVALGAAHGGQLACLQFALQKGPFQQLQSLLRNAAAGGDVRCMRYLHEKGYGAMHGTLRDAVERGSLQCLEYAVEIGCPMDEGLMPGAVGRGVAFVQCLHERGYPWEKGTTEDAARKGCLATLQYCHEHGCSWDPGVIQAAIWADSAACLQYIHMHDCPPLPQCCPPAYNLEVLQYAVENMGRWGKRLLRATSSHLQADDQHQFADWRLLMYMLQKRVPLPPVLRQPTQLRFARFRAVVSCFHLATHLAGQGGPHAPMWGAMGLVPHFVLERITQLAHLKL